MIQTYKRTQRDANEKHQTAVLALEAQIAAGSGSESSDAVAKMQEAHDVVLRKLEDDRLTQTKKAKRGTALVICLQNRVREMIAAKLQDAVKQLNQKDQEYTNSISEAQLKNQDETALLIKKHEEQLQAFEEKIRAEEKESAKVNSKIEIKDLVDKLSQDHE